MKMNQAIQTAAGYIQRAHGAKARRNLLGWAVSLTVCWRRRNWTARRSSLLWGWARSASRSEPRR